MTATISDTLPLARPVAGGQLQVRVVGERRQAFRLLGSGPPLVLLHSVGDSSATWDPVLAALARRHLVVAPDLPGHGMSDPSPDSAGAVHDLLLALGIDRATVLGHSLGGAVALQLAQRSPDLVERLVLVGGAMPASTPLLRILTLPGAVVALTMLAVPSVRLPVGAAAMLLRVLGTRLGADAAGLLRMVDARPDVAAFVATLRAALGAQAAGPLPCDRPTLLMWGERDAVVPVAHARRAHADMPGSRLELLAGAGHFPFQTDPVRFVARLVDFLDPPITVR